MRGVAGVCALVLLLCAHLSAATQTKPRHHSATPNTTKEKTQDVVVVSVSVGPGAVYGDLTESNHRAYAHRHGFDYVRFRDSDLEELGAVVDPKWAKLKALKKVMDGSHKLVVWMDSDMVITNMRISFKRIFAVFAQSSTNLVIPRDIWYPENPTETAINSGVMIFRDCAWSRDFVATAVEKGRVPNTKLEDQPRIIQELYIRGELDLPPRRESERHKHTVVINQRFMNSLLREGFDDPPNARWQPGDFIAHVMGMEATARVPIINNLLNHISGSMKTRLLEGVVLPPEQQHQKHHRHHHSSDSHWSLEEGGGKAQALALDTIEANWKALVIRALVKRDWSAVEELHRASQSE